MNPALLVTLVAVISFAGLAVLAVVAWTGRRTLRTDLDAARADVEALRGRVDELTTTDQPPTGPVPARAEYVITSVPEGSVPEGTVPPGALAVPSTSSEQPALTAGQFATVAVGESLVRVLSLGYGVRRALSASNRNRIRFEVRREVRRARRQRRSDLKEAKRHLRAEQRADLAEDAA
jgi:hypothetical protein